MQADGGPPGTKAIPDPERHGQMLLISASVIVDSKNATSIFDHEIPIAF